MSSGTQRTERGQALILTVLAMTVVFVIGVIIVDVGLWVSERRGAYKDADASALAGAQRYVSDLTDDNGAFDDAKVWAELNGVNPVNIDVGQTLDCSPDKSCIDAQLTNCGNSDLMPWVEARIRHESASIFSGIFTNLLPDIGAEARACVGSPRGATGLSPFGVETGYGPSNGPPETGADCENNQDDDSDGDVNDGCPLSDCLEPDPKDSSKTRPVYGAVCILKTPGQGGVSGQRGQLTLSDTGCSGTSTNQLRHDFHFGSKGTCYVNQDVNTGTGTINGLLQGLEDRLNEEGLCNDRFGPDDRAGYDEFPEVFSIVGGSGAAVVPSAVNVFSENDCDISCGPSCPNDGDASHHHNYIPRAIDLVLIDRFEKSDKVATITGFAGFYVIGCFKDNVAEARKQSIEADLTGFAQYLNRCKNPTGQDLILGIFVKSLAPSIDVGDPDANLPLSIVLVK
jgi:hypothetical protein